VSKGLFKLLPENTVVLGGGLVDVDDVSTHTVQAGNKDGVPPVSPPYPFSFGTFLASKDFTGNLRNTEANKDGVLPAAKQVDWLFVLVNC
jgi:hypothetical protein